MNKYAILLFFIIGCQPSDSYYEADIWNPFNPIYSDNQQFFDAYEFNLVLKEEPRIVTTKKKTVTISYFFSGKNLKTIKDIKSSNAELYGGIYIVNIRFHNMDEIVEFVNSYDGDIISNIDDFKSEFNFFVKHRFNRQIFLCSYNLEKSELRIPINKPILNRQEVELRRDNFKMDFYEND